jgi:serine/threonine-protein kinase PknG
MSERCSVTAGCEGRIVDGFCDVCGMQPPAGSPAPIEPSSAGSSPPAGSQRTGSQRTGSTQLSGKTATGSRRSRSTRSSSRRRLGLGLVSLPELPRADPLDNLMPEAKVPEAKRFCTGTRPDGSACESPLTREKCTRCGQAHDYTGTLRKTCSKCGGPCELVAREKGFCNVCGTPYDFRPKLAPGDVVAGQYEVAGCIAFGGMGWIYLAKDLTLGRHVLLKGLVNSSDPSLAKAAVAERQFLAEVKHPNIVGVYTCVSDTRAIDGKPETHAYTVMEFVGGKTLKALRKERGPLPVAEALAYMHPVLSAFGYMHANQLIYNDFKPDNVMLEQGDIKVIDLGGVCRMTQTDTDIYSTVGYAAPELATAGPSIASDLYAIGRTLAVLTTEFRGFQSTHRHSLRAPADEPLYRQHDSFYKLLLKACHENPNMRFQDAEEMSEQLVGVLREVVARDTGQSRPADSAVFGPDPLGFRAGGDVHLLDVDSLPALKLDPGDPATAFIVGNAAAADPRRQTPVLARALELFPSSISALLAMARHQLRLGDPAEAERQLALVEARDAFEWRVIWLRGLALILQAGYPAAIEAFETCYREVPGELAPKLAIAVAAELAGHREQAIFYYDTVSRTDPSYATAAFGLARCLAAAGKRADAVAALARIAQTSSLYADAQKAIAATLIDARPSRPGVAELEKASSTLDALMLDGAERFRSMRDVLSVALELLRGGHLPPADVKLLGHRLDEPELRRGLEHAYRNLARLTDDRGQRIALVDLANQVRPKTWL